VSFLLGMMFGAAAGYFTAALLFAASRGER
jgi:gas vesicle protein